MVSMKIVNIEKTFILTDIAPTCGKMNLGSTECLDLAKKHELREILSHEAITKAVNTIWDEGIFKNDWNFMLLRPFNVPKILFYVNVLLDFLFFMLLSLMMLTGMCVKARAQRIEIFKNYFFIKIAAKSMSVTDG